MASVSYFLVKRGTSKEKTIQLRFMDKGSPGLKSKFTTNLPIKADPEKWQPRTDKKTKFEKWLIENNEPAVNINGKLLQWKKRLFDIHKELSTEDDYGNKVSPTVESVESLFTKELEDQGVLKRKKSVNKKEVLNTPVINPSGSTQNGGTGRNIKLTDLIQSYIDMGGLEGDITDGTKIIHGYAKMHVENFEKHCKQTLTLDKLTLEAFNNFKKFLFLPKPKGGPDLVNSTAKKYLSRVRDVLTHFKDEYPLIHPGFFRGRYPQVEEQVIFATYSELDKLKNFEFKALILHNYLNRFVQAPSNGESYWTTRELAEIMGISPETVRKNVQRYDLPGEIRKVRNYETYVFDKGQIINWVELNEWCQDKESLGRKIEGFERVRDWYCFASEAPLRHSDLKVLNPRTQVFDKENSKVVRLRPKKTIRHRKIWQEFPLTEYCLYIIDKYKDEVAGQKRLLPIPLSNTQLNHSLHAMLHATGMFNDEVVIYRGKGKKVLETNEPRWSELSFHTSRHNFATNMVARNMNLYHIMRAMGHGKLSTTQIYMELIEDEFYSTFLEKVENKVYIEPKIFSFSKTNTPSYKSASGYK